MLIPFNYGEWLMAFRIQMAKNCKKQLSGAENRKRAKVKAIKTANVLSKVAKLDAYFNIKNAVNRTENTSSINIY